MVRAYAAAPEDGPRAVRLAGECDEYCLGGVRALCQRDFGEAEEERRGKGRRTRRCCKFLTSGLAIFFSFFFSFFPLSFGGFILSERRKVIEETGRMKIDVH